MYFIFFLFADAKYCKSILTPTENAFKQTLQSTFVHAKTGAHEERVDLCCRSLHKCDAIKNNELNKTIASQFSNCECVWQFQTCLNNLNTTTANELSLLFLINTTKCLSNEYPIIKCNRHEDIRDEELNLSNLYEREKYLKRCIVYEIDRSRKKELQFFDVPLYANTTTGMFSKI